MALWDEDQAARGSVRSIVVVVAVVAPLDDAALRYERTVPVIFPQLITVSGIISVAAPIEALVSTIILSAPA
jgi:hypothetical protein